jgi:hypothetical protein
MSLKRGFSAALLVLVVLATSAIACSIDERGDREAPRREPSQEEGQATATVLPPTATERAATATPQPELATATPQEPQPEASPPEIPPEQSPLEVAQIPELEVSSLDPRGTPMSSLGTFRQRMRAEFVASDSAHSGIYHYEAEVNTAAQAVHMTVSAEGAAAQQLPVARAEAIWIGTRLWLKLGNRPWVPVPEDIAEAQFEEQTVSVGSFLPYVPNFQRIEPDETVNGIACARYTYDLQDIPAEYGTVDAHGQIWVALDGGYVVRYTLEAVGTFGEYFQGEGTLKLTYDTFDVGSGIEVNPPRG